MKKKKLKLRGWVIELGQAIISLSIFVVIYIAILVTA